MSLIYYADDEQAVRKTLSSFLAQEGYDGQGFSCGESLLHTFQEKPCDLVVLDIMMPGIDGISVLDRLREISSIPIILLTACDSDAQFCQDLDRGADDYITKPFKPQLLMAKIRAMLRREPMHTPARRLYFGNIALDEQTRGVLVEQTPLHLTPTEFRLLAYYLKHKNRAITRQELLKELWGFSDATQSRAADEANRHLREKLLKAHANVINQTVWGYGYRLSKRDMP
ncbi:DNA-binding response regulator [Atopobiaceae bacterium P1]|nr:DNA-binding response regulator [Atopobiaceae bacterium P1]